MLQILIHDSEIFNTGLKITINAVTKKLKTKCYCLYAFHAVHYFLLAHLKISLQGDNIDGCMWGFWGWYCCFCLGVGNFFSFFSSFFWGVGGGGGGSLKTTATEMSNWCLSGPLKALSKHKHVHAYLIDNCTHTLRDIKSACANLGIHNYIKSKFFFPHYKAPRIWIFKKKVNKTLKCQKTQSRIVYCGWQPRANGHKRSVKTDPDQIIKLDLNHIMHTQKTHMKLAVHVHDSH